MSDGREVTSLSINEHGWDYKRIREAPLSSIASFFTQSGPQVISQLDNPNQAMIENADSDSAADLDNTEFFFFDFAY